MNPNEQARLAAAVHCLRPEWPVESLRTFIARDDQLLGKKPFQDAAVALVWVALDSQTKTPARVNEAGPWWHIGRPEPEPRRGARCVTCGASWMFPEQHVCRPPANASRVGQFTDKLRAELHSVPVCPHGVKPSYCRDCTKAREHAESRRAEDTEEAAK